ncbi:GDSL-type esterase/lipase family protein [Streptomyces sp. HNM0645]|uniref:SGNH/GDSL hydrolase family protein n=1 Tax=Streptomyces sp. HNM0645 TaxID=2782343 RepID=UPI0024B76DA7|nr:SGNH/GDSL hydrolase family protein [Streptomyces sp. HNM0645]MDI9885848.1 GDSL-type esterase/lipase family protein [Streptomyces sp. HNM0645]
MREIRRSRRPRRWRTVAACAVAATVVITAGPVGCDAPPGTQPEPVERPKPSPTRVWDRAPGSLAAVGDSITRGFDACSLFADCPEVSWATGTDSTVRSLAQRLLGTTAATRRAWNHARSGARMADLPAQMAEAAVRRPELVTVMVGANDACRDTPAQMTPVPEFTESFTAAMRSLRRTAPKAHVYVSSVPDLKRLWSTGRGNALGRQIWKLGICASMLGNADDLGRAAQERRALVHDRVVAYNRALRDVCAKDLRCRYDGDAVFDYRFTGEQLSPWDWFHPSRNGQSRLAEIAYRNITAQRPPAESD